MRKTGSLVVAVACAALVVVAGGSAQRARTQAGGTMVIGLEQEPGILNGNIIGGDALATAYATAPLFSETYRLRPNLQFTPELVSHAKVRLHPFSVTYYIRKNAHWYDAGKVVPVTAQDYVFTWRTVMDPKVQILGTTGYDQIASARVINSKTVRFTFKAPYAGWKLLFLQPFPSFALQGADFNHVWLNYVNDPRNNKPVSSGPFMMSNQNAWVHGRQLTLVRNPKWWLDKSKLASIVFRFYPDSQTEAQQIRSGELDVFNPQPQVFLVPLRHTSGLRTQIGNGVNFEHIDFNVGFRRSQPLLSKLWVRQAFAYGINRKTLINALFTKTGIDPGLPVLNNVWMFPSNRYYKPNWSFLKHNAQKAINLMKSHGCTGGPSKPGQGGTWTCQGHRASFGLAWRSGNQLRTLTFEALQAELKTVGIDIHADDSADLFTSRLPQGDYDIALYANTGSPDLSGLDNLYGCRNDASNYAQQNYSGYCNAQVTRLLKQVNLTFNAKRQAAFFNRATAQMAKDMLTIPLYQKPTYLIYKSHFKGLKENATFETFEWNIGRVSY
jgi:peptide/nickel transport system substrate-binding protein